MKIKISSQTAQALNVSTRKILMSDSKKIFVIDSITIEEQIVEVKGNWFRKPTTKIEMFVTSAEIFTLHPEGKFLGTLNESGVKNFLFWNNVYEMRDKWKEFLHEIESFGVEILRKSDKNNLLEEAFEAGREYQAYKEHACLEEKSWDYTFSKWCEKKGIPVTKTAE